MAKVFVGLSGGVDSAVSAYLLKKQGHDVTGVFIKAWEPDFLPCTGARDRLEAMRVAAHLGIPFHTYDLEEEYKRDVVEYFINEYKEGRTPNPDVMCNRTIKFGAFAKRALAEGADFIATGHYSRVSEGSEGTGNWEQGVELQPSTFNLLPSRDSEKDQTYFLWTLTQDDLKHTLFPVGGLEKSEVRALAKEAGLPNSSRPDSQGLCFLGHVDMKDFLKRYIHPKNGPIYGTDGKEVGEHDGAWFYTVGQRIGIDRGEVRHYVVAKDVKKNTLTVSDSPVSEESKNTFELKDANWISGSAPQKALARFRYRQPLIPVTIADGVVTFDEPQLIASGQSLVVYNQAGDLCLGGAIIG